MDSDSTAQILPPSLLDEGLGPTTLLLCGQTITSEDAPSIELYRLSREVTTAARKHTSIIFERIEHIERAEPDSTSSPRLQAQELFYLVHPINAQWREDSPDYYITSASPDMVGNIQFDISKTLLQKAEFKAMLNAKRSAADTPLFDLKSQQLLFDVKPKWTGGQYQWIDSEGRKVAYEMRGKGEERKLTLQVPLQQHMKDALVALWALRIWHDVAESKTAKREDKTGLMEQYSLTSNYGPRIANNPLELEDLTGPVEPSPYLGTRTWKRAAAGGALAGAGGGA